MKQAKKITSAIVLLVFSLLMILTIRACVNTVPIGSSEFERSIRETIHSNCSVQDALNENDIGELSYTGRESGRYSNGIAFFELESGSNGELMVYWNLDRSTKVYNLSRLVLRNGAALNIIWDQKSNPRANP